MEIHLFVAGEQVGPFSEAQVRQYLGEGRVSFSDLGSHDGMENWLPLDLLLASLPPSEPSSETILPDVPPPGSPGVTNDTPVMEQTSFIMQNDTFELVESSAPASAAESARLLTSTQKTKRKLNKIVIQPILPLEPSAPTSKKKPRTGKTALTLGPLRPTTSLPPVTGHLPKVKKTGKKIIRTGHLSLGEISEQPALSPETTAETIALASPPLAEPAPTPEIPVEPTPISPASTEIDLNPPTLAETAPLPTVPFAIAPSPAPTPEIIPEPARAVPVTAVEVVVLPPATPPPLVTSAAFESMKPTRAQRDRRQRGLGKLLYAGVALGLVIVCIVVIGFYLAASPRDTLAHPENAPPPPKPAAVSSPETSPQTAGDYSNRGFARQNKGDLDGAIADYDQALKLDSKNVEAFYRRGLARQAKGDLDDATADYTQVIALDPKHADAFSSRAFIKQAKGDPDGAMADYTQALSINPKISAAYYNEGLIKVQKGDLDGAIAAYGHALDLDPTMALASYNRGVAKNTEGDVDGAIADYTQALASNPNIDRAYCDRGFARQSKGDADGALADYAKALALNPKMSAAYFNRGLIRMQRGDFNGAVADNNETLTLDPKNAQAYYNRSMALIAKGRINSALADLNQFCTMAPRENTADVARLYIWLVSTQLNPKGDADAQLSTSLLNDWNTAPEDLTSKIGAFLLGHISESQLIANAASPDPTREPSQYCKAWYFAGMKRLLGGDTKTAISDFQKSVATDQKGSCEYIFAHVELQALGQDHDVAARPEAGR